MIEIGFYCRNWSFFRDDCNELWECLELNRKDRGEFISSYKFGKDDLIDVVSSMNAGSEVMSKKICNFACNVDIDFSISWYEEDVTWNYTNLSAILWISKWERVSIIQLSLNEIHIKETSMS